ncbi:MAG: HAD hydrolase-like protein [Sphingomicrobium sp.]|nr:HAD hydrolase-like protein [Sphingomonadales bacterium]
MARLAIFDCDGTLVDSAATIHRALTQTLEQHGLPVPPSREARRVIGLSLTEAFAMLVPAAGVEEVERLAATYRRTFQTLRAAGQVDEPLFDGIAELIDALDVDGWLMAVATGKSDRGLARCLAVHGLGGRFVSLQTADRHPSKPHPAMALAAMAETGAAPGSSVMIGDTGWDMGLARAAGIGAIGVAWGYHDAAELLREGAHCVANEPHEVLALAKNAIGEMA